jgi:HEAT repeat protein
VPALSISYRSEDPRLRYAVVKALAEIEDRRGDAVLAIAAREKDAAIRHTAAEALEDRREEDQDD